MTYAPKTISALRDYWVAQGGQNAGIVGDTAHINGGTSYHLGKDHLASTAYSIKTARDRAGLTNAASALDLNHSKKAVLRNFSKWLVSQGQNNAPGTRDIREIIYSPDGVKVLRWDRERGYASAPRTGEADNTHLWHTHISFYRDSEDRAKVGLFSPYFNTSTGDTMQTFLVPEQPTRVMLKEDSSRPGNSVWMYTTDAFVGDGKQVSLQPIRWLNLVGEAPTFVAVAYEPSTSDSNTTSVAMYVKPTDVAKREVISSTGAVDCTAVVQAATAPLKAQIVTLTAAVKTAEADAKRAEDSAAAAPAKERDRIAAAEAARIKAL